ncbi:uncharacterized protein LOC113859123 [Abrus precatorius]|uniref:Uncharacterized protein LOC113859123 n=1 Tax=Abrus precatorius TaxID=3816 RepID=A0A8B8KZC6_ABRPR|nr:uncharacterized protein LOC113859123 [Abrus precatorius]
METISTCRNSSSPIILTKHSLPSTRHNQIFLPQRHGSLSFNPISCSNSDSSSSNTNTNANEDDSNSVQAPTTTPPRAVEISFKRRSRRQAKRLMEMGTDSNSRQSTKPKVPETPKKWEDMTLNEKAIELYMGEKGALFWLNKFAYASIFIMIGGWIVFRFLGPAFNLYQLDAPLLSPSDVFK